MAFSTCKAEINVTPMIDVLLVLLIVFMVILPAQSTGLDARVPQPPSGAGQPDPGVVVITVKAGGAVQLNQEAVAAGDVESRLTGLFRSRGNVTLFVRADPGLTFEPVAQLIDLARGTGLRRVALMPREASEGR